METRSVSSIAVRRRLACHTIARNIAAMSGTSVSSSGVVKSFDTSTQINAPVTPSRTPRITKVGRAFHTRNP